MLKTVAKVLGMEVETEKAGDHSKASSLRGAPWFQFNEGNF